MPKGVKKQNCQESEWVSE